MKKIVLIAVLAWAGFISLSADVLDELCKDIDSIEKKYWRAICNQQEDSEGFIETKRLLDHALDKANLIQKSLVAKKCESSKGSISKEISALRLRVNDFSTSPVRFFRIDVHGTSMDDYFSAFRNSPKAKKGKVLQKPTLASVDLDHYEQWLIDVADKQAEKKYSYRSSYQQKRPKSRERRDSQQDQAQQAVNEYMSRIRKIRLLLVDIRQITDDFMKNRNR